MVCSKGVALLVYMYLCLTAFVVCFVCGGYWERASPREKVLRVVVAATWPVWVIPLCLFGLGWGSVKCYRALVYDSFEPKHVRLARKREEALRWFEKADAEYKKLCQEMGLEEELI